MPPKVNEECGIVNVLVLERLDHGLQRVVGLFESIVENRGGSAVSVEISARLAVDLRIGIREATVASKAAGRLGSVPRADDNFPGGRIENELAAIRATVVSMVVVKIEHSQERAAGQHVERLRVPDRSKAPVVLYKAQDRGRIVEAVIHVVPLCVGRNQQEWHPNAKSAAILNGSDHARDRLAARACRSRRIA
jgi:hypothetical protein